MSHWKDYRCFHCWSRELGLCRSVVTLLALSLMFQACHASISRCKDEPMCSFMASEGECENDSENMLETCPKACRNPCKCNGVTEDTACNCIIKAKEGYCNKEGSMDDCRTTCSKVLNETCPPLDLPEDPNALLSTWSTKYLTSVLEVCNTGYVPVDDQNQGRKICTSNLRWTSDFTYGLAVECERVDCGPPPTSVNAFGVAPDTTYGSKADYVCAKNYIPLQGQQTLTCNASGLWEGQPLTCKRPDCSQPANAPNASFKVSSLSPGGTANYTCAPGYSHVKGDATLTCSLSGVWQGSIIVCEVVDCGDPPSSPNTKIVYKNTTLASTANYSCMEGHTMTMGQSVLTCNASRKWTPEPPVCSKVNCRQPPAVANTVLTVNGTFHGDTANYTCVEGYVHADGDKTLICLSSGTWQGIPLSCNRESCGQPPSIPNTSVSSNGTFYGDTAQYNCSVGHVRVSGDVTLTCGSTGTWLGALLSCEKINCSTPGANNFTNVTFTSTVYGSEAAYTCHVGHEIRDGDMKRTCGKDGTWSGQALICHPISTTSTISSSTGTSGTASTISSSTGASSTTSTISSSTGTSSTTSTISSSTGTSRTTSTISSSTGTSSSPSTSSITSTISSSISTSSNPNTSTITTNSNPISSTNNSTTTNSNKTADITSTVSSSTSKHTTNTTSNTISNTRTTLSSSSSSTSSTSKNRPPSSLHSNTILDAASAWAIGVASFIILLSLIILLIVLNCAATRKRARHMRTVVQGFRNDVAHPLPNFRVSVNWKPNTVTDGSLVLPPGTATPHSSPAPSSTSFHLKDATDGRSTAHPRNITLTSYLTVSSALSPSSSSSSMSISKSPSSINLGSFYERSSRDQMPNIGI